MSINLMNDYSIRNTSSVSWVSSTPPSRAAFVPVTFMNDSNNTGDVYLTIKATPPNSTTQWYLTFDSNGVGSYTQNPTSTLLSSLPSFNGGFLIYMPPGDSGRIYFSVGMTYEQMYTGPGTMPSGWQPSNYDTDCLWDTIEYSFDQYNVMTMDCSGVDTYCLPLQLEMDQDTVPTRQICGSNGNMDQIFVQARQNLQNYNLPHYPEVDWTQLINSNSTGTIQRIIAPNIMALDGRFDMSFLTDYLQTELIPYYQANPLSILMDDNVTVYTGTIDSTGQNFTFTSPNQQPVTIPLPTLPGNVMAWIAPGTNGEFIPTNNVTGNLIKMLSAMVAMGLVPQNIQSPLCDQYFANHRADFYQANAYDVYARAMHDAGLNEYFYAFDDVAGQSGTEAAAWSSSLNVTISLGNFTNSQETSQQR